MSFNPRPTRPSTGIDLRQQLRKRIAKVKKRSLTASSLKQKEKNAPMTASQKWKLEKPKFEHARLVHRALQQGTLTLTIESARNLSPGTIGRDDNSSHMLNPMCKVQLNKATSIELQPHGKGYHVEIETTECNQHETIVHYKTADPVWNKNFEWRTRNLRMESNLTFQIYDLTVDDSLHLMGNATLNIGQLIFQQHQNDRISSDSPTLHGTVKRQQHSLPLQVTLAASRKMDGMEIGRLNIIWSFTPDGCPIAARGRDMILRGSREGLHLSLFSKKLSILGLRAIGNFAFTPCIDDPKQIVPLLRDVYSDLKTFLNNGQEVEISDDEFKSLLALVMHRTLVQISKSGLVRGMDYDGSGSTSQYESTSFFLSRSQAANESQADEGAFHVASNVARKTTTACGAGGVYSLACLTPSMEDSFGNSIIVGRAEGGATVYSEFLKRVINLNFDHHHQQQLQQQQNAFCLKVAQPLVNSVVDVEPMKYHQQHIARKVFLACSDRRIKCFDFPKRWSTLKVGSAYKDIVCSYEHVNATVPLSLGVLHVDYADNAVVDEYGDANSNINDVPLSYLIVGGSTGTVSIRNAMNMIQVARYDKIHKDGVTCIRRIKSSNLNTILTAGMGGQINFIDPLRLGDAKIQTVFQSQHGILAVDWSNRRHSLYTADYGQKVKIWDPMVKKCTGILGSYGNSGHRADLVSVRCADEYNMIVTTDVTGIVKVWDTRTQRCLQTVKDPEQHVSGGVKASIVDDEGRLITGGQSIHRWKTLGAKQERETRVQRKIRAKQIKGKRKPSGSFVAERSGSGMNGPLSNDLSIPLTQEEKKAIRDNLQSQKPERTLYCLSTSKHNLFVTVTADGEVTVCQFGLPIDQHIHLVQSAPEEDEHTVEQKTWPLEDGDASLLQNFSTKIESQFRVSLKHTHVVTSAEIHHNSRSIYIGTSNGTCRQFNLETGWLIQTFEPRNNEISCLSLLALHSGFKLIGGGWDGCLSAWDAQGRTVAEHTDGHQDADVTCLCQIEEAFLASGDSRGAVCLWSTVSKKPLKKNSLCPLLWKDHSHTHHTSKDIGNVKLKALPIAVECLCYSSKRRLILVGVSNGTVVALSSRTLAHITSFGSGVLTTFTHASVDAMCLSTSKYNRLLIMDAGRRIRLFNLGKKDTNQKYKSDVQCSLIKCWQPDTDIQDVSDIRHSIEGDRGTITYSEIHHAFAISSFVDGKFCVQMWSEIAGAMINSVFWRGDALKSSHLLASSKGHQTANNNRAERGGEEGHVSFTSKAPPAPILSSIGEFSLEIDRMKVMENKIPMIHAILHAGVESENEMDTKEEEEEDEDDEVDRAVQDEEEMHELLVPLDESRRDESSSYDDERRQSLDYKLNKMYQQGLVSWHGGSRAERVKKRKERSNRKVHLMKEVGL